MRRRWAITGAASGVGRALAAAALARGDHVIGVDRDADTARDLDARLATAAPHPAARLDWLVAELSAEKGVERVIDDLPPVDRLVHGAALDLVTPFERSDLADQVALLDVNLIAPLRLTLGLLADGRLHRGGSVVFVASLACFTGYPGGAVYAASKAALATWARGLRMALQSHGVHVLVVYPGPLPVPRGAGGSRPRGTGPRAPAERVAAATLAAIDRRLPSLVPGTGNRLAALAGRLWPRAAERAVKRAVFDRL